MSRVNRGAIVNISSVAGLMGMEVAPHYGAAKAGILGFTRSGAREVAFLASDEASFLTGQWLSPNSGLVTI